MGAKTRPESLISGAKIASYTESVSFKVSSRLPTIIPSSINLPVIFNAAGATIGTTIAATSIVIKGGSDLTNTNAAAGTDITLNKTRSKFFGFIVARPFGHLTNL